MCSFIFLGLLNFLCVKPIFFAKRNFTGASVNKFCHKSGNGKTFFYESFFFKVILRFSPDWRFRLKKIHNNYWNINSTTCCGVSGEEATASHLEHTELYYFYYFGNQLK